MEMPCDSKNRKRPSSSLLAPLFNLFTRFEAHADPHRKLPRRGLLPDSGDGSSHVFIKDLRSRRVFSLSPKPKSSGFGPDRGEGKFEKPSSPCGDEGEAHKDDVDAVVSSIIRNYCPEKDGGRDLYKDDDDDIDKISEDRGSDKVDFRADRGGANNEENHQMPPESPEKDVAATEMAKGLDHSGDDCVQATPPEATDVILCPEGNCDLRRADRLSIVEPPQGSSQDEGSGAEISTRNDATSKGEPGHNPRFRSRRRIYKRPGSISYRRLLPYLTDMAMEDPCTTGVSGSQKQEKGMEVKPPQASIGSSYKDIPVDESSKSRPDKPATETAPLAMPNVDLPHDLQKDRNCPDTYCIVKKDLHGRAIDGQMDYGKPELVMQGSTICANSKVGVYIEGEAEGIDGGQMDCGKPELVMQGSTICADGKVGVYIDVVKEKGEAEGIDGRLFGMADDLSGVKLFQSFSEEENIVDQCFHERTHPIDGGMKRFHIIVPPNSTGGENGSSFFAETRDSNCGDVANQMIDTNEARLSFSSSSSGIFGEAGANEIEGNKIKFVTASANEVLQNSPSNTSKACYSSPDKKGGNYTKRKMVLNPCARLNVFKNPNSFSYKRMLPYLKEIAKDDACTAGNGQYLKLLTRSKKESSSPPGLSDSRYCPTNKYNDDHGSADLNISSPELLAHGTCLQKDEDILTEHVIPSAGGDYKSSYGVVNARDEGHLQATSSYFTALCQSKEDSDSMLCQSSERIGDLSANSIPELSSNFREIRSEGTMRNLSPAGSPDLFRFPDEASRRGILKRNPRGCRGLCSCLTCASFRLNAERAFEFSRNQMKDAEEMASNLMKELFQLRSVVEKINCGVSNFAVLEEPQVREACRRALEAEEITKHRLSQMNDELNIHCRVVQLHRPRVTYSESTRNGHLHRELESKGLE